MPFKDEDMRRQYGRDYCAKEEVKTHRSAYNKAYRAKNIEKLEEREKIRRRNKRAQCLIASAKTRCRKKQIEFSLTGFVDELQERIDAGFCELTGYPFSLEPGKPFNSPSLDRIDPRKGYTKDNVRVVLLMVNCAMGDWGEGVLKEVMSVWLHGNSIVPAQGAEFIRAVTTDTN